MILPNFIYQSVCSLVEISSVLNDKEKKGNRCFSDTFNYIVSWAKVDTIATLTTTTCISQDDICKMKNSVNSYVTNCCKI